MSKASHWPTWMDDIWAKSAEKGEGDKPETLAQHTWYVVERLTDFIKLRPELPQTLGVPRLWHILYWAAFLHDFGKAASGFQARLRGGEKWPHRHEVFSLAFLDWIEGDLKDEEREWIASAIVAHHRDASEIADKYPPIEYEDEEDQIAQRLTEFDQATTQKLWRWLAEAGAEWRIDLGLDKLGVNALVVMPEKSAIIHIERNGAKRVYHWLKTYRSFVKKLQQSEERAFVIGTLTLRGYLINADHSASAHAKSLPKVSFQREEILASIDLQPDKVYDHQRIAGKITGSALLIAPTGSGKTEAALLWVAHQAKVTGNVPRLFYTLPYQASMNSMKLRLEPTFGKDEVALQHGRGLLALYRMLLQRDYDPTAAARQAKWIRNLGQLNYPPVRVFSPYQMLKGMYRLSGYEALLSDYHQAAFIFDEIHAYEPTRLAMILKTIEYLHKNFNARFLIMSATFPSLIKTQIVQLLDCPTEINAEPALFTEFQRHRLIMLDGELLSENGLQRVVDDAQSGKSVLVVCNLVDRAQDAYRQLISRLGPYGIPVELLHGRFNMRDRSKKEQTIRDSTGSKSDYRRPIVLVATQAVEVSLDIDLDTIYTDPAPLEALVQRFGRVNRRRKQIGFAPVHVYRQPNDGQKIYDQELVQGTLRILERENERPINEAAIGKWLDEIYQGEIAARWLERFTHAAIEFEAACIRPLRAFESDAGLEERFEQLFDGMEVLPESLYDEYLDKRETEPIVANELLVPISLGRYHALKNKGRLFPKEKNWPYVAKASYSEAEGMTFGEPVND